VSFVALTVQARVRGFDWTLEDAALDLGSSPWRTFRTVTFPLILPGIGAAALLSFALSIDDYIITSFVAGDSTTTFPMRIFNANKTEIPPQVHVIASAILLATVGLMAVGAFRTLQRERS
jgi:spermidine/putrescine transport system permease protein